MQNMGIEVHESSFDRNHGLDDAVRGPSAQPLAIVFALHPDVISNTITAPTVGFLDLAATLCRHGVATLGGAPGPVWSVDPRPPLGGAVISAQPAPFRSTDTGRIA